MRRVLGIRMNKDLQLKSDVPHTRMVGVDVLLELLHGAQADHRPPAEPEGRNGSKLLMQIDEEFMQTAFVDDVLQVSIPKDAAEQHRTAHKSLQNDQL